MRPLSTLALVLLAACSGDSDEGRKTLEGTFSFSYEFDGRSCEMTRTFQATERVTYPWTCSFCDEFFDTSYKLEEDVGDCTEEDFGSFSLDGSGDTLMFGEQRWDYLATALVPLVFHVDYLDEATDGTVVDDEGVELRAVLNEDWITQETSVSAERGFDDGELESLEQQADSYACGWTRSDAPAYTGTYAVANDAVLPDGLMRDACGDLVRMHDFFGSYLLVEWGALDCAPCERYAELAPGMLEDLQGEGIDVNFISVYSPLSLFETPVGRPELDAFAESNGTTFPVMLDTTGWMGSVVADTGYGGNIPVFFLVRPDGTVFHHTSGVDEERYGAEFGDLIRSEAAAR